MLSNKLPTNAPPASWLVAKASKLRSFRHFQGNHEVWPPRFRVLMMFHDIVQIIREKALLQSFCLQLCCCRMTSRLGKLKNLRETETSSHFQISHNIPHTTLMVVWYNCYKTLGMPVSNHAVWDRVTKAKKIVCVPSYPIYSYNVQEPLPPLQVPFPFCGGQLKVIDPRNFSLE